MSGKIAKATIECHSGTSEFWRGLDFKIQYPQVPKGMTKEAYLKAFNDYHFAIVERALFHSSLECTKYDTRGALVYMMGDPSMIPVRHMLGDIPVPEGL